MGTLFKSWYVREEKPTDVEEEASKVYAAHGYVIDTERVHGKR